MNPCGICGWKRGGALENGRYCKNCDATLELTRGVRDQTERRKKQKVIRTEYGVYTPWSLPFYLRWRT